MTNCIRSFILSKAGKFLFETVVLFIDEYIC